MLRIILLVVLITSLMNCSSSSSSSDELAALMSSAYSTPVITEIDPPRGAPAITYSYYSTDATSPLTTLTYSATTITITGTDFSSDLASNRATFYNGKTATILTASTTELVTTVPTGTTTGLLQIAKDGGVCDSIDGTSGLNCTTSKFYVDCYAEFDDTFGEENQAHYPGEYTFEFKGSSPTYLETKAFRTEPNEYLTTSIYFECDNLINIKIFAQDCSIPSGNDIILNYAPTYTFSTQYTVQYHVTMASGTCKITVS